MRNGFRRVLLGGLVLAMSVVWAGPAPARGRDHHRDRDHYVSRYDDHRGRHHGRYERRHRRGRDHYRGYRGYRGRYRDSYRGVPRYYHGHRARGYYCAACRHGYDSRSSFHDHLIGHHHIPVWRLPFVIVHGMIGGVLSWVFYG